MQVIANARAAVDWRKILLEPDNIHVDERQRLTLNGLGQGYVTDRVADLLHSLGLRHILVDLGEQRAIGPRRGGAPWLVARANATPIALTAVRLRPPKVRAACSALPAPRTICSIRAAAAAPRIGKRITVHHRSAAVADALSTALYAASGDEIEALLPRFAGTVIWATDHDDRERQWISPPVDATAG